MRNLVITMQIILTLVMTTYLFITFIGVYSQSNILDAANTILKGLY